MAPASAGAWDFFLGAPSPRPPCRVRIGRLAIPGCPSKPAIDARFGGRSGDDDPTATQSSTTRPGGRRPPGSTVLVLPVSRLALGQPLDGLGETTLAGVLALGVGDPFHIVALLARREALERGTGPGVSGANMPVCQPGRLPLGDQDGTCRQRLRCLARRHPPVLAGARLLLYVPSWLAEAAHEAVSGVLTLILVLAPALPPAPPPARGCSPVQAQTGPIFHSA